MKGKKGTGNSTRKELKVGALHLRIVTVAVFALGMIGLFAYNARQSGFDNEYLTLGGEQLVLSQRISKNSLEAAQGDSGAFGRLQRLRDRFQETYAYLEDGNANTGLPPMPVAVQQELAAVGAAWQGFRENVDTILGRQEQILSLGENVQAIGDMLPSLLALSDEVVTTLIEVGAAPQEIYIASRQLMLTQRIANNVRRVVQGGQGAATAADRFGRDTALFGRVLDGMLNGNTRLRIEAVSDEDARAKLREVSEVFAALSDQIGQILQTSPELFLVYDATDKISSSSPQFLGTLDALVDAYQAHASGRMTVYLAYLSGGISLLLLLLFGWQMVREARQRQAAAERETKRNQDAIMRLLDEMGDLAQGDLTVNTTVTEEITGAIADSINFVIEQLRKLVTSINEASVQVSSASQETQATAMHLAEASDHQAQQITGASAAINEMATTIDDVSKNAAESAQVAKQSVETAQKGAETVQATITGMDTIREQIQETSKRIKRLGESSQEIGDIVGLITDIADQTNILALNAAIQAAMAGEAGRGFAVVADEVQRLAERSGNATKQIEALVKTIQTDTNEAVISMEHSTTNVVAGAKLAEDAGHALEEIEDVSRHLAGLIESISGTARQQASAAANMSDTMNVIQEITTQTSAGTNETATSIGNLAELANELRKSVAGFKLPD